jgi:hypothetical protein
VILVWILLLLFASMLPAQSNSTSNKELWNWYFWEALDTGKFRIRGVAQFRSQPHVPAFLRSQGGPILEWQATKRWNLIAGYYFQEFRGSSRDPEMKGAHRPFGGVEYGRSVGKVGFETRHLFEYFKALATADSARGRARVRFEFPLKRTLFLQNEVFYDQLGVQANRTESGLVFNINKTLQFQPSVFYEGRPQRTGGSRLVFNTRITVFGPLNKTR